jgi:raffinose/stachyose/melibiose transport system permease protein
MDNMGYASSIAAILFVLTFTIGAAQVIYSRRRRIQW